MVDDADVETSTSASLAISTGSRCSRTFGTVLDPAKHLLAHQEAGLLGRLDDERRPAGLKLASCLRIVDFSGRAPSFGTPQVCNPGLRQTRRCEQLRVGGASLPPQALSSTLLAALDRETNTHPMKARRRPPIIAPLPMLSDPKRSRRKMGSTMTGRKI